MNKRNYQKELDGLISGLKNRPSLLLHGCCAPCSSYCVEYLCKFFDITLFYYNPNVSSEEEFILRKNELYRLIKEMPLVNPVAVIDEKYEPKEFFDKAAGYENCPEGGERCYRCYELRLKRTAEKAKAEGYDYFCTTLSISPLKNADWLNRIGESLAKEFGVKFLPSDFKKNGGYLRSIELSKEYGLYRQNFCGCEFSKKP